MNDQIVEHAMTPIRYRMRGDLQWQYTERMEQAAHAAEVQRLRPEEDWMPLTAELLNDIEAGEHGTYFWLAVQGLDTAGVGAYAGRQGRNPHGFESGGGSRWGVGEITHVRPYRPPALPTRTTLLARGPACQ